MKRRRGIVYVANVATKQAQPPLHEHPAERKKARAARRKKRRDPRGGGGSE